MEALGSIRLNQEGQERLESGHPWLFKGHIAGVSNNPKDGDIVEITGAKGRTEAAGYINRKSKILVRVLEVYKKGKSSFKDARELVRTRIFSAAAARRGLTNTTAKRLFFSEADGLPGLVVDLYGTLAVIQVNTLGADRLKEHAAEALLEIPGITSLYEKSLSPLRKLEGLPPFEGFMAGEDRGTSVIIEENGLKFVVDVSRGSKTGFYADQRENRLKFAKYAEGQEVLDCFSYTGGFAAYALKAGAANAVCVDSDREALATAAENMKLNFLKNCVFTKADAFDYLREARGLKLKFGLISLDPPPFSKSKDEKRGALEGYGRLLKEGFSLLKKQGVLFLFSCSHNVGAGELLKLAMETGKKERVLFEQVEHLTQPPDHPHLKSVPETLYLKGIGLRKKS